MKLPKDIPENYSLDKAVPTKSDYLKKEDCDPPIQVICAGMTWESFEDRDGGEEIRAVLHFRDGIKPMVLNQVNKEILKTEFNVGKVKDLRGLTVELYNDPNVMFGPKRVGGIRIRKPSATPEGLNDDIPF